MHRATPTDLEAILALDARCFARPWSQASWETEIDRDWVRVWTFQGAAQSLGGYAVCWHLGDDAELLRIAVAPDERNKGRGKELLAHCLACAKQDGCARMCLEVEDGNLAAIALYKALGFEQVGTRPGYYAGKDALLFACSLASL